MVIPTKWGASTITATAVITIVTTGLVAVIATTTTATRETIREQRQTVDCHRIITQAKTTEVIACFFFVDYHN